ncbi:MAG: glycosyltransferase family 2 protein [Chloroflexi bacterium]|nr:glycosyltransferase family 2 protein [Chloroflexota bacterium]
MKVTVIIPALNEVGSIGAVIEQVRAQGVSDLIVVDNDSTDGTSAAAARAGARVLRESRRGYGNACATGVAAAPQADAFVFIDADLSFLPAEMPRLLEPLMAGRADLVLGSRTRGYIEPGSMPLQQRFGNWLGALCLRRMYGAPVTDLGLYRAVSRATLSSLDMREWTLGWPIEMIAKAARRHARIVEVPISYHSRRAGQSKVSGTVRGSLLAGYHILSVILRHARG